MATYRKVRRHLARAPREAMSDALGLAAFCGLIMVGFSLPAWF